MYRFAELEARGARVAVMTEVADVDIEAALSGTCGISAEQFTCAKQVHGSTVVSAEDLPQRGFEPNPVEADGLTVRAGGPAIGVRVADCVPILLFDPEGRRGAALHAGRRGLVAGIAAEGVRALGALGAVPERTYAAIGPSAGPCCYEVSEPMAAECAAYGMVVKGRYVDLWSSSADQLLRAGIPDCQIMISHICTICTNRFHSFRRTGGNVRNVAVLTI